MAAQERHYIVSEIAEFWKFSPDTVSWPNNSVTP
jgi:hypothetical protein